MADWSRLEVDLIVADYFSMLNDEIAGTPYKKSEHRAMLAPLLNHRSEGSIEFKHQNISAALINLGLPYIRGYKPRFNYQELLEAAILDYVHLNKAGVEKRFDEFAEAVPTKPFVQDFSSVIVPRPEPQSNTFDLSEPDPSYGVRRRRPLKINYLEREQRNAALGEKGEQFALEFERWLLIQAGRENLAEKIEWISKDDDSAGFDILSKNENGTDKYIEVKTTKLSKEAPFYFSKNEYRVSKIKKANYHLYRIFQFGDSTKMFHAQGSFDDFCLKEPVLFRGMF